MGGTVHVIQGGDLEKGGKGRGGSLELENRWRTWAPLGGDAPLRGAERGFTGQLPGKPLGFSSPHAPWE